MDYPRYITQYRKDNVDEEVCVTSSFEEDTKRWKEYSKQELEYVARSYERLALMGLDCRIIVIDEVLATTTTGYPQVEVALMTLSKDKTNLAVTGILMY